MVRDWKYDGNDLDPIVNASSVTECKTRCYQDANCKAFTWSTRVSSRSKSKCTLKSDIGRGGQRKLGYVSGHRLSKRDEWKNSESSINDVHWYSKIDDSICPIFLERINSKHHMAAIIGCRMKEYWMYLSFAILCSLRCSCFRK